MLTKAQRPKYCSKINKIDIPNALLKSKTQSINIYIYTLAKGCIFELLRLFLIIINEMQTNVYIV